MKNSTNCSIHMCKHDDELPLQFHVNTFHVPTELAPPLQHSVEDRVLGTPATLPPYLPAWNLATAVSQYGNMTFNTKEDLAITPSNTESISSVTSAKQQVVLNKITLSN